MIVIVKCYFFFLPISDHFTFGVTWKDKRKSSSSLICPLSTVLWIKPFTLLHTSKILERSPGPYQINCISSPEQE